MKEETQSKSDLSCVDMNELVQQIRFWAEELGFQQLGISDTDLFSAEKKVGHWTHYQMKAALGL